MVTRIAQRELRNNNAEIIDRVEEGESFVVTRNGVAVADVVPHSDRTGPPMFPKTKDVMSRKASGRPALDREAWLRDIHEGDNDIDDPLDSRA